MRNIPISQRWRDCKRHIKTSFCVTGLVCLSTHALSQTTLYEHDFANGLGGFSETGRVYTGSYGVRLRGGSSSTRVTSGAIDVAGASDLSLTFNRSTSGLDSGETATASYSFDGTNFTALESVNTANGAIELPIPTGGDNLYIRFALNASSFFESYTIAGLVIEGQTGDPDNPDDPDNPPNNACDGSGLQPGLSTRTLNVGGLQREYILNIPGSYNATSPLPVVLDFHPLLNDAEFQLNNSGMRELSEQEDFIVAFPNGIDNAWNFGPCCTESRQIDDLAFSRAVVEDIAANACVDEKRVYAAGYSNGGGMSYHLACNAADMVAAVAPAAFDLVEEVACNPSRPISVFSKRGRFDFIVPYSGGESTPPTSYNLDPIHFLGAEGTFDEWGDINNCPSSTNNIGNNCEAYQNCSGGTEVVLCTESFGGHSGWDADEAWDFLKTQTLP